MLADRLRMIKTESLPDFVTGYPVLSTYTDITPPVVFPAGGEKYVFNYRQYTNNGTVEQLIQFRLNYVTSSTYFYFENRSSGTLKFRIIGSYNYGSDTIIPAGKRWLFVRSGSVSGYPYFNLIEY